MDSSIDNIKNIDSYQDEIDFLLNDIKEKFSDLKSDILDGGDDEEKILLSLESNFDLRKKVGFIISYDQDSHLLIGDGGFGVLKFNKSNGSIDMENSLWITDNLNKDKYLKIKDVLGDEYNSFSVFDNDRIFSKDGNLKLDLETGEIIFSSDDVQKYDDELNKLGIKDHGVFYDELFLKSIIKNRDNLKNIDALIKSGGSKLEIKKQIDLLMGGKPIMLCIIPSNNDNLASKYNNLDVLNNDYTILYYQVGDEIDFKNVLGELSLFKKYGLNIDKFYWEEHANKNHIYFTPSGNEDIDMISDDDLGEYIQYSDLFENTNVLMNTCLAGKKGGKSTNITDFLVEGLFSKSNKVISPRKEVYGLFMGSKEGNGISFDDFVYYGQNDKSQSGIKKQLPKDEIYVVNPKKQ